MITKAELRAQVYRVAFAMQDVETGRGTDREIESETKYIVEMQKMLDMIDLLPLEDK